MTKTAEQKPVTVISTSSPALKKYLTKITAKVLNKEQKDVKVEEIVGVLAEQFPDVILLVAEENWLAGYEKGLEDSEYRYVDNDEAIEDENGEKCSDQSDGEQ